MGDYPIKVYRGDSISLTFTVYDKNGAVVNITNDTIYFTVKLIKNSTAAGSVDTTAVIGPKKNAPGGHSDPTNGETVFVLSSTETAVMPGNYYYDVEWVTAANLVTTLVVDYFTVLSEVTTKITG